MQHRSVSPEGLYPHRRGKLPPLFIHGPESETMRRPDFVESHRVFIILAGRSEKFEPGDGRRMIAPE